MVDSNPSSLIPGRGGASLVLIRTNEDSHTLLLSYGASRETNFDDFWFVNVDRKSYAVTKAKRINMKELDNFTTRNSMASVAIKDKVVFFGGQDSEKGINYNDMFVLDIPTLTVSQHQYAEGKIAPEPRNSHTLSQSTGEGSDIAYLFGGANEHGPRKDLYKLDLKSLEFSNVKLSESAKALLPSLEMHTAHVY